MASGELGHDNLRRALQGFVDLLEFDMEDLPTTPASCRRLSLGCPCRESAVSATRPSPFGRGLRKTDHLYPSPFGRGWPEAG